MSKKRLATWKAFLQMIPNPQLVTRLELPKEIKTLRHGALAGFRELKELMIHDAMHAMLPFFDNTCESLEHIHVHIDNPRYMSKDGLVYDKSGKKLLRCPPGRRGTVNVPEGVEVIGQKAFHHCKRLGKVILPSTVKTIQSGAFAVCEFLNAISLPLGIKKIPFKAFFFCISLDEINLPSTVRVIEKEAFLSCRSLKTIRIPLSTKIVQDQVFAGCPYLKIGTDHERKPQGWSDQWNPLNRPVKWSIK
jgi:hypothetical protein